MPLAGPKFGQIMARCAADLTRDTPKVLGDAALKAKKIHLDRLRSDTGGDLRLSGVGRSGARLNVKYTLHRFTATLQETGPGHLIERPTKPHRIPKAGGRRRRAVVIPGVGVRAYANHPGTRGKATWAKGRAAAEPVIRKEMRRGIFTTIQKAAKP